MQKFIIFPLKIFAMDSFYLVLKSLYSRMFRFGMYFCRENITGFSIIFFPVINDLYLNTKPLKNYHL